jgi:hypothetical protein
LALIVLWLVLSLVLDASALMTVDLTLGVLALATVVPVVVVGALSYLRAGPPGAGRPVE